MTQNVYFLKKCRTGPATTESFYRRVQIHTNKIHEDFNKSCTEIKGYTTSQNYYNGPKTWKVVDLLTIEDTFPIKGHIEESVNITTLSSSLDSSSITISLTSGSAITSLIGGSPTTSRPAYIRIDDELIKIVDITGNVATAASDGRGWRGTNTASHSNGSYINISAYSWLQQLKYIFKDGGVFYMYYGADPDITTDPATPTRAALGDGIYSVSAKTLGIDETSTDETYTPSIYDLDIKVLVGENIGAS